METDNDMIKNYINNFTNLSFEINNNFIDIIPEGINKGRIVSLFMKKLGIKKEDSMAIGDSENDFSMFEVVEESYYINDKLIDEAKYKINSFNQFITIKKNTKTIWMFYINWPQIQYLSPLFYHYIESVRLSKNISKRSDVNKKYRCESAKKEYRKYIKWSIFKKLHGNDFIVSV